MQMKTNKIYGFPVFSQLYDDYKDNNFQLTTNASFSDTDMIFEVETSITNPYILEQLKNNNFVLCCHVECSNTRFRQIFIFEPDTYKKTIQIPVSYVSGEIELLLLLIANKTITEKATEAFSEFYDGLSFTFNQNAIVGFTETDSFVLNKMTDASASPSELFMFIKDLSISEKKFDITQDNGKINILLPAEEWETYCTLRNIMIKTKHSIYIEPALTYVISELQRNSENYTDQNWYNVIEAASLSNGFGDFESTSFKETSAYIIAQKILKNPSFYAIAEIARIKGGACNDN